MAVPVWTTNQVLTSSDVNTWFAPIVAIKTANESVTSSTAFQDDDHLSVSVATNSTYQVKMVLFHDGSTAADLKIHFIGPASATFDAGISMLQVGAASTGDDVQRYVGIGTDQSIGLLGAGSTTASVIDGILVTAGTAGTFKLQWAQDTSGGTATRLLQNSHLILQRIS